MSTIILFIALAGEWSGLTMLGAMVGFVPFFMRPYMADKVYGL
jgi:hypothetical protein